MVSGGIDPRGDLYSSPARDFNKSYWTRIIRNGFQEAAKIIHALNIYNN
jgi:hypothetical protein